MDLANNAQTHPFAPVAMEIYVMDATVDTTSTMEPVNLVSLIANIVLMILTVKYCIRPWEGLLSRQRLE